VVSSNPARHPETESTVLERLRAAYEQQGFSFVVQPRPDTLPAFLGPYCPDAIARKDGENVIIEVKQRQNSSQEMMLGEIRRRIADHKGWKLNVIYATERRDASVAIPAPRLEILQQQVAEVEQLVATGHVRAAFILSWSLLEAALNRLNGDDADRLRNPGQVVQSLAMGGYIGKTAERNLRILSDLRNRIVHGDLDANASGEDVKQVLAAINETLVVRPQ